MPVFSQSLLTLNIIVILQLSIEKREKIMVFSQSLLTYEFFHFTVEHRKLDQILVFCVLFQFFYLNNFVILQLSIEKGDRILVFSQSLLTLDLIESFLANYEVPLPPKSEEKPPENGANYGCLEDLYRYKQKRVGRGTQPHTHLECAF